MAIPNLTQSVVHHQGNGHIGPKRGCRFLVIHLLCYHYLYNYPVNSEKSQCCMSNVRNTLCLVSYIYSHVDMPHVACRF